VTGLRAIAPATASVTVSPSWRRVGTRRRRSQWLIGAEAAVAEVVLGRG
jgi:hypothetical protein